MYNALFSFPELTISIPTEHQKLQDDIRTAHDLPNLQTDLYRDLDIVQKAEVIKSLADPLILKVEAMDPKNFSGLWEDLARYARRKLGSDRPCGKSKGQQSLDTPSIERAMTVFDSLTKRERVQPKCEGYEN